MRNALFAAALSLFLIPALPAFAFPVMQMPIEDFVLRDGDFKDALQLDANQQTLWDQVETKMRDIVRARQKRRDQLQKDFKSALSNLQTDSRALFRKLDEETNVSAQEDKNLRELWLEIDDALSDSQRKIVFTRFQDRLERAEARGFGAGGERGSGEMRGHGMHQRGGMSRF